MFTRFVSAVSALTVAASSFAATLNLGDQMPPIGDDADWIQGSPITEWEEGKVYVMDFWATWCGPCISSIPHVNDLSKQYADQGVSVIGMAIWPREGMVDTAEYVKERGDEMSYLIASDVDGKSAEKYMRATDSNGIPRIMIVDQKGRLAWSGHPMSGFDEALEQIVNGTFDIEDAKALAAREAEVEVFMREANRLAGGGEWDAVAEQVRMASEIDTPASSYYAMLTFTIMANKDRCNKPAEASAFAQSLFTNYGDDAEMFAEVANFIATGPIADGARDCDLATRAAKHAIVKGEDNAFMGHAALASVYHAQGEADKAVTAMTKAIKMAGEAGGDPKIIAELEKELGQYSASSTN